MNRKLCIIGHIGGNKFFNDGQTVKTKTLCDSFRRRNIDFKILDTYYSKRRPLYFFVGLFIESIICDDFIVLLSENGRRILFPFLSRLSKKKGKRIMHYVIGSKVTADAQNKKELASYLKSFTSNWVEGNYMIKQLETAGVYNGLYVPNYKNLTPLKESELNTIVARNEFKFCTFSRVVLKKGIEDAINAVEELSVKYPQLKISLDIYGPVSDDYRERFFSMIEKNERCSYGGVIEPEKSVEILRNYFCLLFPTHWITEGLPGTIIDAFCSGLPVIARRWSLCDELITDGKTGLVYDFDKPELLKDKIEYSINYPQEIILMKKNCIKESSKYTEEVVLAQIIKELGY